MTMIPRHLENRLHDGRVIPFIGAGVSMAAERRGGGRLFPSWKQLLLDGAARLERDGKKAAVVRALVEDDEPDYLQAAKKLRDKLGARWGAFLKDTIDVPRAEVDDRSLELARAVWHLGSRLVVTTNYDQVPKWACPDELRDDCKTWDIDAPAEQAEYLQRGEVRAPTVWHLHGHIDNAAGLVLTPDGYATLDPVAGQTEPRHQAALVTLRHLLASRSFLFVGFSLDDVHFGVELERMLDVFEGFGGPHYALVHQRDAERLRLLGKLVGHSAPVWSVAFSPDGKKIASGSWDRTIRLWYSYHLDELADADSRKAAFEKLFRASLDWMRLRRVDLRFEPTPDRPDVFPINGYTFPQPRRQPRPLERPRPPGKDPLEWLLENAE